MVKIHGQLQSRLKYYLLCRSGLVQSKLRQLILKMEMVDMVILAHPYTKAIDKVHYCLTEEERVKASTGSDLDGRSFGLDEGGMENDFMPQIKEKISLSEEDEKNITKVYTTSFYVGFSVERKQGKIYKSHYSPILVTDISTVKQASTTPGERRQLNITWPVQDFLKLVKSSELVDESMKIVVNNLKRQVPLARANKSGQGSHIMISLSFFFFCL